MQPTPILGKTYDLLKYCIPIINALPKSYKYVIGERIHTLLGELMELMIEANYLPPGQKKPILHRINILLEKLRYYFRLGFDLGLYNSTRYRDLAARIEEIGRMTGGWLKSLEK